MTPTSRWLALAALCCTALACDSAAPPLDQPDEPVLIDEGASALSVFHPDCRHDDDCLRGYTCERRGCGADAGVCVRQHQVCDREYRPECGCDGVTYPNRCERVRAGADLHSLGECRTVCGGIQGLTCADDQVCLYEAGVCGEGDRQGVCVERPQGCPDHWEPVCGCDGHTYSNRCDALAAGASVRHAGSCERPCKNNSYCERGEFCQKRSCSERGTCQARPDFCPLEDEPVCGCDNHTYRNRCTAHAAGVSVAYRGTCERLACHGDQDCRDDQFCETRECHRDATAISDIPHGRCVESPQICTEEFAPVCGCDGVTYSNDCFRRGARVSKVHEGPCDSGGCFDNDECRDGFFCARPLCDAEGRCREQPAADHCQDVVDPVCGCDGVTYENDCLAAAHGASVLHPGACRRECGGPNGQTCEEGEVCDPFPGSCAAIDPVPTGLIAPGAWGICRAVRDCALTDLRHQVCGCDGKTYPSDCERLQTGAAKLHDGPCEAQSCEHNSDCGDREWCAKSGCFGVGSCHPRPEVCTDDSPPVCGCDGQTHGSRCDAAAAGVNVAHEGECATRCGGIAGLPCGDGEFCDLEPGTCNWADVMGVCVEPTDACPEIYRPVCGCDGKTYSNDCFRIAAKMTKDHDGRCECPLLACDVWCEYGHVLDENGCETCQCREPPIIACCDPHEQPGHHGNPFCIEGATCCADGKWRCNDGAGHSTCGASDAAGTSPSSGEGRVCRSCCDPAAKPGHNGNPHCFEGASCCGDGQWHCNDGSGTATCDVMGQVCQCSPVVCTLACEFGFKEGPDGCQICECNPPPCCDPDRQSCGPDAVICPD